jgi:hypothetical protein
METNTVAHRDHHILADIVADPGASGQMHLISRSGRSDGGRIQADDQQGTQRYTTAEDGSDRVKRHDEPSLGDGLPSRRILVRHLMT